MSITFNVTYFSFALEKPRFDFSFEKYNDNVIFCLQKGSFTYGYDEKDKDKFTAKVGDIIFCKSGDTLYRNTTEPITLYQINFKTNQAILHDGKPIKVLDYNRLKFNLDTLKSNHATVNPSPGGKTEHYCRDIIYLMLSAIEAYSRIFNIEYIYIHRHFNENLKIDSFAKHAGFSVAHFINLFKEEYGQTPKQYIVNLRIKNALYLLKNTTYSISAIAEMCGYDDPLYFSRLFKKHLGFSPQQARKQNFLDKYLK